MPPLEPRPPDNCHGRDGRASMPPTNHGDRETTRSAAWLIPAPDDRRQRRGRPRPPVIASSLPPFAIPTTLHASLLARLDRHHRLAPPNGATQKPADHIGGPEDDDGDK